MNSFTRIGLPIALVIGVVFGITFIRMHSAVDPDPTDGPKVKDKGAAASASPVEFGIRLAAPQPTPPPKGLESLTYWDPVIEVGAAGHFEFWCHNKHPQPVTVRVSDVNCQCAGVEMAVVPPEVFRDYAITSALAGGPFGAAGPIAAIAHVALDRRLEWAPLEKEGQKTEQTIPAATPAAGTQVAIVRLGWKAKGEPGPKTVYANVMAELGDSAGKAYRLETQTAIVPAFDVIRRDGPNKWAKADDLLFGELRENAEVKQVMYLVSATRRQFLYTVTGTQPDPCVTWTEPAPASEVEVQALLGSIPKEGSFRRPRSVYKVEVTVRERTEAEADGKKQLRQLDLGLLERRLTVSAVDGGSVTVAVRGRVFGDISFLTGAPDGRVDLGNAFPADQDFTKDMVLLSERAGLDLTLDAAATTPNYLKVKLEPLAPIDGRNQWKLRVTVPKGSVYTALPVDSAVVLTTTGPSPRRLRIPVRGMAVDRGGPRL